MMSITRCAVSETARQKRQRYKIAKYILGNRIASLSANDVEAQQSAVNGATNIYNNKKSGYGGLAAVTL